MWVPWAGHWNTYDPSYTGHVYYESNTTINSHSAALPLWFGFEGNGRNVKNITIRYNTFGLYLKNNARYKPGAGILFWQGGSYTCSGSNIHIHNNAFNFTYDTGYTANLSAVRSIYYQLQASQNTGVIAMNIPYSCSGVNIHDNTASQFPYSFLNCYRRSNSSGTYRHTDIICDDNTITDSCYAYPYQEIREHAINVGSVNGVSVQDNAFTNPNIALLGQKDEIEYVSNLTYSGNTFT